MEQYTTHQQKTPHFIFCIYYVHRNYIFYFFTYKAGNDKISINKVRKETQSKILQKRHV